ncbi:sugar transferase [Singulisphaera sp. PoT]|uniref:sugar transferase n=1 Tax=Singulisphaera sp. PoT TaxID=3411797 RepID=UPI003BF5E359
MVVIAVMTRLDSKGPTFSRQTRMGRDGLPFEVWMFRTLVQDGDLRLEEVQNFGVPTAPRRPRWIATPASRAWGGSCVGPAWTSCRSSSTCCSAR